MVMRVQETTVSGELNRNTPAVELGNTSIHSAYMLECCVELTNESGESYTPDILDIGAAFENISVQSDNTRYHYSISGKDIIYKNAMSTKKGTPSRVIDMKPATIADEGSTETKFVLFLEEGDVIGLLHDTVTLKATVARELADGVRITGYSIKPSIIELIPSAGEAGLAELAARYGEGYAGALEPKVYAVEQTCHANSEFTGFFNLPTGSLLRGAMMQWTVAPKQLGLIATVPSRAELCRNLWLTRRAMDERMYGTEMPENCNFMNFDAELTNNGLGLDGRAFNRGDYQVACRTDAETRLRYVSYEMMYPAISGGALNLGHSIL